MNAQIDSKEIAERNPQVNERSLREATTLLEQLRKLGLHPQVYNPRSYPKARPDISGPIPPAVHLPIRLA